jgi:hypothetical protein
MLLFIPRRDDDAYLHNLSVNDTILRQRKGIRHLPFKIDSFCKTALFKKFVLVAGPTGFVAEITNRFLIYFIILATIRSVTFIRLSLYI